MKNIIIMGNGPSLKNFNFELLKNKNVLGMNAAYRYWEKINWFPNYYACLDPIVALSHYSKIKEYGETNKFKAMFLTIDILEKIPELKNYENIYYVEQFISKYHEHCQIKLIKYGIKSIESHFFNTLKI